ncbi:MAG: hypothetical protein K1X88_24590 [Nannocystaceae bacterium]|nr:hypothetical protein [Nannocystaceae bacterium]
MRVRFGSGVLVVALAGCAPERVSSGSGGADGSSSGGTTDGGSGSSGSGSVETSSGGDSVSVGSSDGSSSGSVESSGGADSSDGGPPPLQCGNGVVEGDEGCDDGNLDDGDACDHDCVPTDAIVWSTEIPGVAGANDCAYRVAVSAQGVWVAGIVRDAQAASDGLVARLDPDGALLWRADFDSQDHENDEARGLALADDDTAYVGGAWEQNGSHTWLQRVEPDGTIAWAQEWFDGERGSESAVDLALVDGAPWLAAYLDATGEPLLLRYGTDGVLVAADTLAVTPGQVLRPSDLESRAGATWLFGLRHDEFFPGGPPTGLQLGPDASIGTELGVETFTDHPSDGGVSGALGPDGSLVLVSYDQPAGGETPTVRRFDPEGTLAAAWLIELDDQPEVEDVALDANGDVIVAGRIGDAAWARRSDAEGALLWDRRHTPPGGDGRLEAVAIAPDDGAVIVAGCIADAGGHAAWVRRYQP